MKFFHYARTREPLPTIRISAQLSATFRFARTQAATIDVDNFRKISTCCMRIGLPAHWMTINYLPYTRAATARLFPSGHAKGFWPGSGL